MVIMESAHSLWIDLLHWNKEAEAVPLFYKPAVHVLRTRDIAPFNIYKPSPSIDISSHAWFQRINSLFPGSVLDQTHAFKDTIPVAYQQIFA